MRLGNSVRSERWPPAVLVTLGVLALLAGAPRAARADDRNEAAGENVFQWADRGMLRRLEAGRQLLAQGRFAEAARYLGEIAEASEDYFVQSSPKEPYRSLKAEAHALIGRLPPAGRESYELQYGARARHMLVEAVAAASPMALADVSRRFFHTEAGYEATFMLGLDNLERGSPLTGALTLRRLRQVGAAADRFEPALSLAMAACWLQAGGDDEARKALLALKRARGSQSVEIAGREVRLFDDTTDPVAWLVKTLGGPAPASPGDQLIPAPAEMRAGGWLMARGNPARNASSPAGGPLLNTRWRVGVTNDPLVEADLQQLRQRYRDEGVSEAPVLQPLAVGNVVLMRSVRNLVAVDADTGKRLWEVPVDDHFEARVDAASSDWMVQQNVQLPVGMAQRIWDDASYGTLSSDGRLVYSIEDLDTAVGAVLGRSVFVRGRRVRDPGAAKPYNRLEARDIRTGKLRWHLGGPADQFALRLAEVFFLGPPLPLAGRLYVLGELKEEIRLYALAAETGDLLWSQQLAVVEQPIHRDAIRRLAGATPSYADGILVCPTSAGAVVAVELATRSLLWGYRYGREQDPTGHMNDPLLRRLSMIRGGEPPDGWSDASITLADGRVLVSPVETNEIHCLNLLDGKRIWKQPRADDLYLACVTQGKVLLVGRHSLRALRLADGAEAWPAQLTLPDAAVPSGRGYLADRLYYLPLSSAEVLVVDVSQGRVVRTVKSRDEVVPGNLFVHQGRVISQSVDGVESFYQLDALRRLVDKRLAERPDDAEALALRGEILIDEGQRRPAIEALRQSYRLAADVRTRKLLRETLLDGLREQFATYSHDAAEIERLLDDPRQTATYQRLMAAGYQALGKWDDALVRYGKLADMSENTSRLEVLSRSQWVRRDRWLQTQLAAMREAMPAAARPKLDAFVAQRFQQARKLDTIDAWQQFLDQFGTQPDATAARAALLARLIDAQRLLEAEQLLSSDFESSDRKRAAWAAARLGALLRQAGRAGDAAVLYTRLAGPLAEVVLPSGRSGRQTVDALAKDDPVRAAMGTGPAWPTGKVEISRVGAVRDHQPNYGKYLVRYREAEGPFFEGTVIQFDQNRPTITCRDRLGNVRWQVPLVDPLRQRAPGPNAQGASVKVHGHLMVLSLDGRVVALDTTTPTPRVLWTEELGDGNGASRSRPRAQPAGRFGLNVFQAPTNMPAAIPLGPVNERLVCFQRYRDCVAVDPLRGCTLWIRREVPVGSAIFGDAQYVFIVPPNQDEALVLNSIDGTLVARRKLPAPDQWLGTNGRYILLAHRTKNLVLERYDPWTERSVWQSPAFSFEARICGVGHDFLASGVRLPIGGGSLLGVVEAGGPAGGKERDGRFVLLAADSGRAVVDAPLRTESAVGDAYLLTSREHYVLVVSRQAEPGAQPMPTQPMPGVPYRPLANGLVYCFNHQGKPVWPAPVKVENQYVLLEQPADLPAVVFACQSYQRRLGSGGQMSASLLCIDKRTGRVVLQEKYPGSTGIFELVGDVDRKTIDVRLQQSTIRLRFTEAPYTAADEAKTRAAAEGEGRSLLDALWRSAIQGLKKGK
jgi:outer membrane protein assembly factor BamB